MKKIKVVILGFLSFLFILNLPEKLYAMHIMEGFLPFGWALTWWIIFIPFFLWGLIEIKKVTSDHPNSKLLLGVAGAFVFVLSALKIPSVTGSSSHATGIGLGTIIFGPQVMAVLGSLVLLFQALLLAHGGITTLGANAISMAVVGPFVAFAIYKILSKLGLKKAVVIFCAAAFADLSTYLFTAFQLALAFPTGGYLSAFLKFSGVFAMTQIPLAITEGLLTVLVYNWLQKYNAEELKQMQVLKQGV